MTYINKKIVIISILLALITTYLIFSYISGIEEEANDKVVQSVFIATRDIEKGEKIDKTMFKEIKIDSEYVLSGAIDSQDKILGKYVVEKILKDEQLVLGRISNEDNSSLSFLIPSGKRALTIAVNEVKGTGFMIKSGDIVDILATFESETENINGQDVKFNKITKTIASNIQILTVGSETNEAKQEDGQEVKTYSLAVTSEEAEIITYAEDFARIRLVLRPVNDNTKINTTGVYRNKITPSY